MKNYSDVSDKQINNLLLGNGFSINFSDHFKYSSILEKSENLSELEREIFNKIGTNNFEKVLRFLWHANLINEIYGIQDQYTEIYQRIKNELIKVIRKIHVEYGNLPFHIKGQATNLFKSLNGDIFTTNYDLLIYWITMNLLSRRGYQVGDLFRDNNRGFLHYSPNNEKLKHSVFYLHGALHLYNDEEYIKKIGRCGEKSISDIIEENLEEGKFPLFVAEGTWKKKLEYIKSNQYLSRAYDELENLQGNLTIFGHNLDEDADYHIAQAINNSNVDTIYFGIYTNNKSPGEIDIERSRITGILESKTIEFYSSDTFLKEFSFGWALM